MNTRMCKYLEAFKSTVVSVVIIYCMEAVEVVPIPLHPIILLSFMFIFYLL